MVDNFELIKTLITFTTEDDFYHVQIIKRKKEHPELGSNNHMVKAYYIKSLEDLDKDKAEMMVLANHHNARVMINLNRRSFEKLAFQTLKKVTDQIINKDFRSTRKAYNTVVGQFNNEANKKWIIDIDTKDEKVIKDVSEAILKEYTYMKNGGIAYGIVPTKNGVHIICSPFHINSMTTADTILAHDIHKDNPTILYIP